MQSAFVVIAQGGLSDAERLVAIYLERETAEQHCALLNEVSKAYRSARMGRRTESVNRLKELSDRWKLLDHNFESDCSYYVADAPLVRHVDEYMEQG